MKPIDINLRCYQCGSRRLDIQSAATSTTDDPVYCRQCRTYLGRRSDIAWERRRLFTGAANEPREGEVARLLPVTERANLLELADESEPSPGPVPYK